MDNSILITRPDFDDATHYLNVWSSKIVKLCQERGIDYIDLDGEKADSNHFRTGSKLIAFNGHGDPNTILGNGWDKVLVNLDNCGMLKDTIVHSVSCESAKILGNKCIETGTKAFIGYKEKFNFIGDTNMISRPPGS